MINLDKYEEIIIWGACLSMNDIETPATSHGYAVEKLFHLLESNSYEDKIVFL